MLLLGEHLVECFLFHLWNAIKDGAVFGQRLETRHVDFNFSVFPRIGLLENLQGQ
jgi:hypothetical protein